jgi:DNA-binding XRE family transcriptional regulator
MAAKVKKARSAEYTPARVRVALTPGDSVRIARELQEMTQAELAAATGIAQPTLSSIESGRSTLGADRAEKLARALRSTRLCCSGRIGARPSKHGEGSDSRNWPKSSPGCTRHCTNRPPSPPPPLQPIHKKTS